MENVLALRSQINAHEHGAKGWLRQGIGFAKAAFKNIRVEIESLLDRYLNSLIIWSYVTLGFGVFATVMLFIWPKTFPFLLLLSMAIVAIWEFLLLPVRIFVAFSMKAQIIKERVESTITRLIIILFFALFSWLTCAQEHPALLVSLAMALFIAYLSSMRGWLNINQIGFFISNRILMVTIPLLMFAMIATHVTPDGAKQFVKNSLKRINTSMTQSAEDMESVTGAQTFTVSSLQDFVSIPEKIRKSTGQENYWYIKRHDGSYFIVEKKSDKAIFDPEGEGQLQDMNMAAIAAIRQDLQARQKQPTTLEKKTDIAATVPYIQKTSTPEPTPVPTPTPEPDSQELSVILDSFDASPQKEISTEEICGAPPPYYSPRRERWESECRQKANEAQNSNGGIFTGTLAQDATIRGKHAIQNAPVQGVFEIIPQDNNIVDVRMRIASIETTSGQEVNVCTLTETQTFKAKKNLMRKIGAPAAIGAVIGILKTKNAKGALEGAVIGGGVGVLVSDLNSSAILSAGTPVIFKTCHR